MIHGRYLLDLTCDAEDATHPPGTFPAQFTGISKGECLARAKSAGWRFAGYTTSGKQPTRALCPLHARKETTYDAP